MYYLVNHRRIMIPLLKHIIKLDMIVSNALFTIQTNIMNFYGNMNLIDL